MSGQDRPEERTEQAIVAAVDQLEGGTSAPTMEEIRPWVELWGLLPQELEPVAAADSVKAGLMRRVRQMAGEAPQVQREDNLPPSPSGAAVSWVYRLAAVLAVALLGVSAKQAIDLAESDRRIGQQAERITELQKVLGGFEVANGAPEWMAASGTELCALRPQVEFAQGSKGWLFVREDHQHWYVAVEGLRPSPANHVYELWFLVGDQSVSGGRFQPGSDGRVSLTSESMPSGITGIAITLEPEDGDSAPSDEMLLYGDEVMLTL